MNRNIIVKNICLCGIAIGLASCSNTKNAKFTSDNSIKTHNVEAQTKKNIKVSKLKETNSINVKDAKVILARPTKPSIKKARRVAKTKQYKPRVRVQNRFRPVNRRITRQNYVAPVKHIKYAKLSGDYADNSQTRAFINMMASKHGFDKGYLNYLFSNTQATPFLKRMAYSDANPSKRIRKGPRRSGRWTRYRGNFLTEKTINKGIQFWRQNRVALKRAEEQFGVPQEYILGIIGVETRYGGNVGKNRAIDALAAMGFDNARRGKYFRSELESYLLMTRSARLDPLKPMASYAGALGLCQFMPSNIKRYAVDHDRSGSVNLWTSGDAIGSVANYFKKHGWRSGGTVAVKANSVNSRYKTLKTGFKSSHSLARLRSKGVSANNLGNISGKASLIKLNTYSGDELWLGGHNFYVITRYNHSSHYAMAVHQLAQAIKGRIGSRGLLRQASR